MQFPTPHAVFAPGTVLAARTDVCGQI